MNYWMAHAKINGDGYTKYQEVSVEISNEEYDEIQKAILELKPLEKCSFYKEFIKKAEENIDWASALPWFDTEPVRENYESDEEYEEEKAKFEKAIENDLWLDYLIVDDPGDLGRLNKEFIGKTYSKLPKEFRNEYEFEYIDDYDVEHYCGIVSFDDKGTITKIEIVKSEGIESVSIKYTNTNECYPDFGLIEDKLAEDLDDYK